MRPVEEESPMKLLSAIKRSPVMVMSPLVASPKSRAAPLAPVMSPPVRVRSTNVGEASVVRSWLRKEAVSTVRLASMLTVELAATSKDAVPLVMLKVLVPPAKVVLSRINVPEDTSISNPPSSMERIWVPSTLKMNCPLSAEDETASVWKRTKSKVWAPES